VAAVYANALGGPLLLDDDSTVARNASIREIWPVSRFFTHEVPGSLRGRPLVSLSFAINYARGGVDLFGYRLVNVGLHALAGLMLFAVLRRTLPYLQAAPTPGDRTRMVPAMNPQGDAMALVCALLWVVHPLNTEVVNYLTQRTESMMALWFLAALYFAIRSAGSPGGRGWEVAAAVSTWLAVMSKEVALLLPLVVAGWDRVHAFPSFRVAWQARWRLYVAMASSWLLFAAIGRAVYGDTGDLRVSPLTYAWNQGPIVLRYLWLSIWPQALVFDYGVPEALTLGQVWPSLLTLLVLIGAAMQLLWLNPRLGFWAVWVFVILAPTSSIVPISTEVGAERRMYLPLVGILVLLVTRGPALLPHLRLSPAAIRRTSWAAAVVAVSMLAIMSVRRNQDYASALAIWQTVVDRRPHWRAHEHLGLQLRAADRPDESIAALRLAAPESRQSRHALAAALLEKGQLPEAIRRFRDLIREDPEAPDIPLARAELAQALTRSGDRAGAIEEYRAIKAMQPDWPRNQVALAIALEDAGEIDAAIAEYRGALAVSPNDPVPLSRLGVLLQQRGNRSEAFTLLERADSLHPPLPGVKLALAQQLLEKGDFPRAEAQARAVVSLVPGNVDGYNLLGVALASQGRLDDAAAQFSEALRLNPRDPQAAANLAHLNGLRRVGR
jgi:Flp pilus assembly protein TadD